MNNKVIKVLDREHGKKVIEFFKQYCDTGELDGSRIGSYYGIINGEFDYWFKWTVVKVTPKLSNCPKKIISSCYVGKR